MYKLQEPSQIVQCREEDLKVVEGAIAKVQAKYKSAYGSEAPQLTIDRKHFLPKAASSQEEEDDPDAPTWSALRHFRFCLNVFKRVCVHTR
jgi:hypothetical protein